MVCRPTNPGYLDTALGFPDPSYLHHNVLRVTRLLSGRFRRLDGFVISVAGGGDGVFTAVLSLNNAFARIGAGCRWTVGWFSNQVILERLQLAEHERAVLERDGWQNLRPLRDDWGFR